MHTTSYTICSTISYAMSYTMSYTISYTTNTNQFIPVAVLQQSSDCASRFQLPCAWTLKHGQPHLFCIIHRDISRERPTIAPHPDVDLEKAATCSTVWPGIGSCIMWNFIPQGVRNCILLVPHHVARKQRDTAKNVFHRADIELLLQVAVSG